MSTILNDVDKAYQASDAVQKTLDELKLQQEAVQKAIEALSDVDKSQAEINLEEAKNPSLFISGWRPATGWVCVIGLAYQILFRPIIGWFAVNTLGWEMPMSLDIGTLVTLLSGLLGLGGLRTAEKIKGVARKH